jgi:transposase
MTKGIERVRSPRCRGPSRPTVDKWLKRYKTYGMDGLVSMTSPGGPRQIPDRIRARVLALTRTTPPSTSGISHWSSTEMARYIKKAEGVYVSQTWVSRLWRENGLTPWRQDTFKISKDPDFEDKVHDVVGLYHRRHYAVRVTDAFGDATVFQARDGVQVLEARDARHR